MKKRKMLYQLFEHDLWEKLSPEEIRLYLLLVVISDKKEGKGRITLEEINSCLSIKFTRDKLKRAISNLQKCNLVKMSSFGESDFHFKL